MDYLQKIILSLALGIGSCSNLSSSPEGLEAMVSSVRDIDLPTNSSEGLPITEDIFPDTAQTNTPLINPYSPEIRSQEYFFTKVEDHYSLGLPSQD